jgi:hypothetical protein
MIWKINSWNILNQTISTAKDNEIINTVIENEPPKRVTRSTAKKIKLESLNQPKNLQNINEFEEQNELEAATAAAAKPKRPKGKK